MFCTKCGTQAQQEDRFCAKCGTSLTQPVTMAAPTVSEPAPATPPIPAPVATVQVPGNAESEGPSIIKVVGYLLLAVVALWILRNGGVVNFGSFLIVVMAFWAHHRWKKRERERQIADGTFVSEETIENRRRERELEDEILRKAAVRRELERQRRG